MKIALGLQTLTDTQTVTLASTIISDLTGNLVIEADPPVSTLTGKRDAAQNALNAVAAARQALTLAVTKKDEALDALRDVLTTEATSVETQANVLPPDQQQAAIESAGMQVQATPTRVTSLGPVTDLSLTASDSPGILDWHCDPVDHARLYVVEYTTDPVSPTAHWVPTRASPRAAARSRGWSAARR